MPEWLNGAVSKTVVPLAEPRVRISPSPHYSIYLKYCMYSVYVLFSEVLNKRYIGSTRDVNKRIKEHNSGKSKFTKAGIPWKLIYQEHYQTNQDARQRELFLKSGVGRKFIDKIVEEGGYEF